ncbi:ATP-binding cassette sub-family C member 8-like [Glandiceps talaboti]
MANTSVDETHWFCGEDGYLTIHEWSVCRAEAVCAIVHMSFLITASLVLTVVGCCTTESLHHSKTLIHFPGHYAKWTLSMLLCLVLLCAAGEGILTDVTRNTVTHPYLYTPQLIALCNGVVTLVYYHNMECWSRARLAWLLLVFWLLAVICDIARLITLTREYEFDVFILRFDLIIFSIVVYTSCLLVEVNLVRSKVLGWCYQEKPYPRELKKRNILYNYRYTNFLSQMVYWSLNWLFWVGYKRPLEITDLGNLPDEFEAKYQHRVFQEAYNEEKKRADKLKKTPSLWRTYFNAYGRDVGISAGFTCLSATFGFIPPVAVGGVVSYATKWYYNKLEEHDTRFVTAVEFFSNGFVLIGVMFIAASLKGFTLGFGGNIAVMKSVQVRSAIQTFTYEKALRLSSWNLSSGTMTVGQITNHMSVDAVAIQWICIYTIFITAVPYQLVVILALLYFELGFAALIGSAIFLIVAPLQYFVVDYMSNIQNEILKISDQRLMKSNELLQGMKLLKLYGWEEMFCSAIEAIRSKEIRQMMKAGVLMIITTFLAQATPIIVTFVSFAIYSRVNPSTPLTPDLAFASLALFNQLVWPMAMLPNMIGYLVAAIASTRRLQSFFAATELENKDDGRPPRSSATGDISSENSSDGPDTKRNQENSDDVFEVDRTHETQRLIVDANDIDYGSMESSLSADKHPAVHVPDLADNVTIQIDNGNFTWEPDSKTCTLSNINVEIDAGKLTMIVGLVGSGKSSLLSAILGEMTTVSGTVRFNRGTISYVPQKAWLQNATFKDNILFGNEFRRSRYQTVLEVCALGPDIEILPAGDQTEIGEKGINLSGGQKQRVSVARALYSHTNIVLMDDPLSALDVHVTSHLMEKGIMNFLLKENRTVVLVTHQIQYLSYADKVIFIEDGQIVDQGNLNDIEKHDPELFSNIQRRIQLISESENESDSEFDISVDVERKLLQRRVSMKEVEEINLENAPGGSLIEEEERERGSVSWRVYLAYARAIKLPWVVFILIMFVVQGTIHILNNFWLSEWSESGANITGKTQEELNDELDCFLNGYAGLSFSYVGVALIATSCQIIFSLLAAKRIHIELLRNIIHAPMRFFDTTPIGRILNRFANDTQYIDQKLWLTLNLVLITAVQCTSAIIVNVVVTPIFIAVVLPLLIGYFTIMKFYITTSRELKRLDSTTISPVFAHFSETLGGLSTIRAYRDEHRFRKRLLQRLDSNNIAQLFLHPSNRWMGTRLEFVGASILLISGLSSLLTCVLGNLEPSWVGLAITYALSISGFLTALVRAMSDLEMQMNAVERVEHYTNIDNEEYRGVYRPPKHWPEEGDIKIEKLSARYGAFLDPVLQNVSINLKRRQKIGICGRTGSGKSSLTLALFRMIDTYQGNIYIDNIKTTDVPLLTLRSRLAIIPQDPVLFSGTIRFNLDPAGTRSDTELWDALEIAQLKTTVEYLDDKLDSLISDEGDNFSVGQRQLFCLARAFLKKTQILVMDEATASVDMKTDTILKNVIRTAFADRTVLTIAHRISTIVDSDMVLVLSDGQVMEYDSPQTLLRDENSLFSALVRG